VKKKNWLEFLIIWIGSSFLGIQQVTMTFWELSLISISDCLLFDFYFTKTFLITEILCLFHSSTIITLSIWWTFILTLLNQLWSILRILKPIFETFWLCLVTLILGIICRTLSTLTIHLIAITSSLLQTLLI